MFDWSFQSPAHILARHEETLHNIRNGHLVKARAKLAQAKQDELDARERQRQALEEIGHATIAFHGRVVWSRERGYYVKL